MKKRLLVFVISALCSTYTMAQFTITTGNTAADLASSLGGSGVTITNPVMNCPGTANGIFSSAPAGLGITDGVVLTSGSASDIDNTPAFGSTVTHTTSGDSQLDALVSPFTTTDVCVLEFDIFVLGDTLSFDYIFSSEEYDEFVCSSFNDVFGFFVSGPNPSGGSYTNQNIATIPGSMPVLPVAIGTVNNGTPGGLYPASGCASLAYSSLYQGSVTGIMYDGNTVVLPAKIPTIPCQTYHLKLAVGDVTDRSLDSGVFLAAGSFSSPGPVIAASSVVNSDLDYAVEGCVDGQFTFTLSDTFDYDLVTHLQIGGTATNGVDYPMIADSIVIPAGDTLAVVSIAPILDGAIEGFETVTIYTLADCGALSTAYDSATLRIFDSIPLTINPQVDSICAGDEVVIEVDGANLYTWSPTTDLDITVIDSVVATPSSTIFYALESNLGMCTYYDTIPIYVSDLSFTFNLSPIPCGATTGAVLQGVATDSIGVVIYDWSNGGTTSTISNLAQGLYSLSITDEVGCSDFQAILVPAPSALSVTYDSTNVSCFGGNDGTITVGALSANTVYGVIEETGGVPGPTNYYMSNGVGQISLTGFSANTYTFYFDDTAHACFDTITVSITEPTALTLTVGMDSALCNGDSSGLAWVIALGATPSYLYQWNDYASQTNDTAYNLPFGLYQVVVTDSLGCSDSISITVEQPTPLVLQTFTDSVTCFGASNGQAWVVASGATPTYAYAWSNGQLTDTAFNLSIGTYNITVTDANGCIDSSFATIEQPDSLQYNILSTRDVLCNGDSTGFVLTETLGGSTPYAYNWSNSDITSDLLNVPTGFYYGVVTDANGCIDSIQVLINEPAALYIELGADSTTCLGNDGTAYVDSISGGTTPYSYLWSNSSTTDSIENLTPGWYTVTATDDTGCVIIDSTEIFTPVVLTKDSFNVTCFGGDNGWASVEFTNGVPPYTYAWSIVGAGNVDSVGNLTAGTYSVTITSSDGCIVNTTFNIQEPTDISLTISSDSTLCFGDSNGSATVVASGGTPGYTYLWNDVGMQTTATATGLPQGNYEVVVTDNNNCTDTANIYVFQPDSLFITLDTIINVEPCNGDATGQILVSETGGTTPYSYAWTNGSTTQDLTGALAGNHTLTLTDANGCIAALSGTITQPTALSIIMGQISADCFGDPSGKAFTIVSGGAPPYVYAWSNSGNTDTISGLLAGNYSVTVTDSLGCTIIGSVNVLEPAQVGITIVPADVSCFGGADGSAAASGNGGTAPYTFVWEDGQTTSTAVGLSFGTYDVTITDDNGCSTVGNVTINEPPLLVATVTDSTDEACSGYNDGTATVTGSGGTPPYTYLWSGGAANTSTQNTGMTPGTFTVTITDDNGCTATDNVIINPAPFFSHIPDADSVECFGQPTGAIHLLEDGGTPPNFQYSINGDDYQNAGSFFGLSSGIYNTFVTDANDCISGPIPVTVHEPNPLLISIAPEDTLIDLMETVPLQLLINSSDYSMNDITNIVWTPSTGLSCADCANPIVQTYDHYTEYMVTVFYSEYGCTMTATAIVRVDNNLNLFIPSAFTPNQDGTNDVHYVYGEGLKGFYFAVFNRWGEKVFESNNQSYGWDGTYKGAIQQPGVYTYSFKATYLDNKEIEQKGSITLIR